MQHATSPPATRYRRAPIRVLDLFAGAGGLTAGFHSVDHPYSVVRAVESDLAAAASYAHTFGEELIHAGTIEQWLREEDVPNVDVVVGGPPCQGFSTLGKRAPDDDRNLLWREYVATVAEAQPRYFVLENVPAFEQSPEFELFRAATQPGGTLDEYTFNTRVLNAADHGAAQSRKRVVVIGRHRDLPDPGFPDRSHAREQRSVADVLDDVEPVVHDTDLPGGWTEFAGKRFPGAFKSAELHLTRHYTQTSLARFDTIPPGGNRFDIPDHLLSPCWRKHKTGSGDVMGRLDPDKPAVTIRTEFFKPEKGRYLHPTENRALTHYEAALLQGFPEEHQWVGSKVAIARQIGNAVPIALGQAIATHLAESMDKT